MYPVPVWEISKENFKVSESPVGYVFRTLLEQICKKEYDFNSHEELGDLRRMPYNWNRGGGRDGFGFGPRNFPDTWIRIQIRPSFFF